MRWAGHGHDEKYIMKPERANLEDLSVDGRIILESILKARGCGLYSFRSGQ